MQDKDEDEVLKKYLKNPLVQLIILIFAMIGFIVVFRWLSPCNAKNNCFVNPDYNVAENQW
jgi:hypothetical protein